MHQGEVALLHIAGAKGYGAQGFPAWGYPFIINTIVTIFQVCSPKLEFQCFP